VRYSSWPIGIRIGLLAALPIFFAAILLSIIVYQNLEKASLRIEHNSLDVDLRVFRAEIVELARQDEAIRSGCINPDVLDGVEFGEGPFFRFASDGCPELGTREYPEQIFECLEEVCVSQWTAPVTRAPVEVIGKVISLGGASCGRPGAISLPGPQGCLAVWRLLDAHNARLSASRTLPLLMLLGAVLASVTSIFFSLKLVSKRINNVNGVLGDFAAGQRTAKVPEIQGGDELDELARGVNAALRKIQQDFASSSRLSGSLSHQMLAPVRRIRNTVSDLLEALRIPDDEIVTPRLKRSWRQQLEHVQTELNHVVGMGESLLNFLSASRKRSPEELSDIVDLDELCTIIATRFRLKARQRNIDIRLDVSVVKTRSSQHVVDQILSNLVDNAIIYGPSNATVTLSVGENEDGAWLAVHDEGSGPPQQTIDSVFSETIWVRTTISAREGSGGHGIGLLTVRQLADSCDIVLDQRTYVNGWAVILLWKDHWKSELVVN